MGTLLAAGCSQPDLVRNTYDTFEDCVRDYRDNQCHAERSKNGATQTGRFLGPIYAENDLVNPNCIVGPGPGRANLARERRVVGKGGFGSTGCDTYNSRSSS